MVMKTLKCFELKMQENGFVFVIISFKDCCVIKGIRNYGSFQLSDSNKLHPKTIHFLFTLLIFSGGSLSEVSVKLPQKSIQLKGRVLLSIISVGFSWWRVNILTIKSNVKSSQIISSFKLYIFKNIYDYFFFNYNFNFLFFFLKII